MPALSFIIRTDGRKMKLNALKILCPEVRIYIKNKHALDQENDQAKNKSFFLVVVVVNFRPALLVAAGPLLLLLV